ncbi:hypothetical protein [uncultured Porticoccus sp.]|uniref:hypothetical protein n=1 Tax=uncultured Porticoccus sp. TaxID=1256050 RepID=UPI0030DA8A22|tara:strand:- start:10840 stop:11325 length:486 start_codon:yes stop_codon:yes gene_type:complete
MPDKTTLLTRKLTDEQQQQFDREKRDWDRLLVLLDLIQEGYLLGEIKFDRACVLAVETSKDYEGDELELLPIKGRNRLLGEFLHKIIAEKRPPTVKVVNVPESIKKIVAELVKRAHENGYVLTREDSVTAQSAFLFVADLMWKYGIKLESSTIEKYYQRYK